MAKYVKLEDLSKLTNTPAAAGHYSDFVTDTEYEKRLNISFGINDKVCRSKRVCMGRTIIPPNTCNERHVHLNAEAAMYIVKGPMIAFLGPEAKKVVCPTGTFLYAPEGLIHGVANPSKTKEVELVFSYGGVPSKEAAQIVFIDDSENEYPPKDWDKI